ncbi:MAG: glycoside hydrolase family 65 protein, partial [Acidimicrobiales bacterium]
MIDHPSFAVEPWCVRATSLDLDVLAQTESVFALSNGHIGMRGNLDEGEPHGLPGTYLASVCEDGPLPYAEAGYGYPESGQTVINVTNGKLIRLLVDDEPFDVRYGRLRSHQQVLDFRAGVLDRRVEWETPAGQAIRVVSQRLVSFVQRSVAAICYEVTPLDQPARVVVQSELVANEALPPPSGDPRVSAVLKAPLEGEEHSCGNASVLLVHRTKASGLRVGAIMDHAVDGPADMTIKAEATPDVGRVTVVASLEVGQKLRIVKYLAYGWSAERSLPAVGDQVAAALTGAVHTGWDGLVAAQRRYLDEFWGRSDVEIDGDPEVQQAVRFALFHVLQAGARAEGRGIAAKGLTGTGYGGHCFWDTETFVLPVLTYTLPAAAADALRWRHSTLDLARARAGQLGLTGAAFPWRTIRGAECSGYWPAGTAAFHVGADIADAVVRYIGATDDTDFERHEGLELLVETARLWCSLGHHNDLGHFRIDGTTGPDEYSAVADNNVYTNLMAQRNLRAASAVVERYPDRAQALGVAPHEAQAWRAAAGAMFIPYDQKLGVHPQSEGFTSHEVWDFEAMAAEQYPLLLHFPYFDLYRKQVVKQADLVLAMHLRGDAFSLEEKARNFAYYERLTVRDSSLSAATQSVMAAEVGDLALAHDYLGEAALMDLDDIDHNTRDGLHVASLAGSWISLVAGFG